ncbi:hypothetical protein GR925_16300 [Streptomyces sp. HUCO-GS316]|uniref:hypothetical protein n=1 Tax=Streptomyces sp. HUCO-GS316 TaxID=2692198 RepID=UPI00136F829B|nr:hypothetical protein [Streptomyces sp. HUCO-GS316]MXM64957.1 hypothetical protein [Streptomyces sp. HUCO-GS316]
MTDSWAVRLRDGRLRDRGLPDVRLPDGRRPGNLTAVDRLRRISASVQARGAGLRPDA